MAFVYNSQLDAFSLYHKAHEDSPSSHSIAGGPTLPALGHALAGSIGSAVSNLSVFPLDLVITRLQVQRQLREVTSDKAAPRDDEYAGLQDAIRKIYHNEGGLSAFYGGVLEDTGKSILDSFLFFFVYNSLRTRRLRRVGGAGASGVAKNLSVLDELSVGALAGAFAKAITTPIANVVTRKQTASMLAARSTSSETAKAPSISAISKDIYASKGLAGFWAGYSASLILTLNPSLTFFFFNFFKRAILPRTQRDNPGARATFLLAAVSKAIASSITYPFSLAKARAQTASKTRSDSGPTATTTPSTPLAMVLHIARTEGVMALYEGLGGEVLKGFFSNGITMMVKDFIHKFIIHAYYVILKLLKRYPSPSELAKAAGERAVGTAEALRGTASERLERGKEMLSGAPEMAKNGMQKGMKTAGEVTESAREKVGDAKEGLARTGGAAVEYVGQKTVDAGQAIKNTRDDS
ncbi:MAG: hypothetical protein M1824_002082 [Vezdaea acicularis]|nr:MAG: hypothetical protein M1824_002082 [Vezdaea acicularis]